jgi:hypothetical protein
LRRWRAASRLKRPWCSRRLPPWHRSRKANPRRPQRKLRVAKFHPSGARTSVAAACCARARRGWRHRGEDQALVELETDKARSRCPRRSPAWSPTSRWQAGDQVRSAGHPDRRGRRRRDACTAPPTAPGRASSGAGRTAPRPARRPPRTSESRTRVEKVVDISRGIAATDSVPPSDMPAAPAAPSVAAWRASSPSTSMTSRAAKPAAGFPSRT